MNCVKIYSMNLYHDKYIIKRHFTCTSANDDSLSTIKWDNLAWYSSDFNDFRVNNTSGCRIVIRSVSRREHAKLSCIILPSLPSPPIIDCSRIFLYMMVSLKLTDIDDIKDNRWDPDSNRISFAYHSLVIF